MAGSADGELRQAILAYEADELAKLIEAGRHRTWRADDFGTGDRVITHAGEVQVERVKRHSLTVRAPGGAGAPAELPYWKVLAIVPEHWVEVTPTDAALAIGPGVTRDGRGAAIAEWALDTLDAYGLRADDRSRAAIAARCGYLAGEVPIAEVERAARAAWDVVDVIATWEQPDDPRRHGPQNAAVAAAWVAGGEPAENVIEAAAEAVAWITAGPHPAERATTMARIRAELIERFPAGAVPSPADQAAEAEAARRDRRLERAARLDGMAAGRHNAALAHDARAHAIADMIPMGQPILVGHHSERRHRRDLARIDGAMAKASQVAREGRDAARRAGSIRADEAERVSGPGIERRLERLAIELRDLDRRLDGTSASGQGPATGPYREQLVALRAETDATATYWREQLDGLVERGEYRVWTPADFAKGERIRSVHGAATVERVNPRTLTVRHDVMPQITGQLPYHKVLGKEPRSPEAAGPDIG